MDETLSRKKALWAGCLFLVGWPLDLGAILLHALLLWGVYTWFCTPDLPSLGYSTWVGVSLMMGISTRISTNGLDKAKSGPELVGVMASRWAERHMRWTIYSILAVMLYGLLVLTGTL